MSIQTVPDRTCKYLGLKTDPRSLTSYPSLANCCYNCQPEATPTLEHQRKFCLDEYHANCPVFNAENSGPMPVEFIHRDASASFRSTNMSMMFITLAIALGLAVAAFVLLTRFSSVQENPTQSTPATTLPTPRLDTPVSLATKTPTAILSSPTPTTTSTATIVPTPTVDMRYIPLDTPIGTAYKVIIHRVTEGESLTILARDYKTTEQAIMNATHGFLSPLWVGNLIIIPQGSPNWDNQPALEPYQIIQESVSMSNLSALLGVDVSLLKYYNGCDECQIQKGSWIVVPHAP